MQVPTPSTPEYFEYRDTAIAAGLSPDQLAAVIRRYEADYPSDLMLRELHILRACNAVVHGRATLASILDQSGDMAA
jgi:hypothetical protein